MVSVLHQGRQEPSSLHSPSTHLARKSERQLCSGVSFVLFFHPWRRELTLSCGAVFFACCIAGAGFTLLLPEVKGRDADLIDEEEMREAREREAQLRGA